VNHQDRRLRECRKAIKIVRALIYENSRLPETQDLLGAIAALYEAREVMEGKKISPGALPGAEQPATLRAVPSEVGKGLEAGGKAARAVVTDSGPRGSCGMFSGECSKAQEECDDCPEMERIRREHAYSS
jgi:hypothetical protein